MRIQLLAGIAMLTLATAAAAETRNLSGFTGVSAVDRIRVEVTIGGAYRVDVTGADAGNVLTRVDDDETLIIRRRNRPFWGGTPPIDAVVRVTMPAADSLASSRGAELNATGVNAQQMSLAAAMGGELRAAGTCATLDAAVSMGGVIRAEALECRDADVAASMGGEARVFASNRIDVAASMGGTVNVAGGGQVGDVALSMGGALDRD